MEDAGRIAPEAARMLIPAPHGHLEAHLRPAEGSRRGVALVCHPHPQHGGTMHTKAVFRTAQALNSVGFDALRFNYRGVGTSTGSFGEGIGEQEDVRTALDWLSERNPGLPLVVAGFSFGSRMGLGVGVSDPRVDALVGLGLPLTLADFSCLDGVEKPVLVIQGEHDEFGSADEVEAVLKSFRGPITMRRIDGSDHYFHDHFEELQRLIREYFTLGPGARILPDSAPL